MAGLHPVLGGQAAERGHEHVPEVEDRVETGRAPSSSTACTITDGRVHVPGMAGDRRRDGRVYVPGTAGSGHGGGRVYVSGWLAAGTGTAGDRHGDGQVHVPWTAGDRHGVQPVATLTVDGGLRADVASGQVVTLRAVAEVPPGTGEIVSVGLRRLRLLRDRGHARLGCGGDRRAPARFPRARPPFRDRVRELPA
ncbi:hypothetical protein [Nonomuraea sp. NPDC003709]|uniref:hypothetical protein n=1 Tax=Nonomuraea sp. NPDC003709 TaxID=3154450 RepID=UPI0033A48709